jgi:hypothetical protein
MAARTANDWLCPLGVVARLLYHLLAPSFLRWGDPWAIPSQPTHAGVCDALSVTTRPKRRAFFFNASTARLCCAAACSTADTLAGNTPNFSV